MKNVELVQLSPAALHALAAGDLVAANTHTPLTLSTYFVDPERRSTWVRRSKQIVEQPESATWITRVVVDTTSQVAVGAAGFHGPPDATGMVEIGYGIDPAHQRQGYARAAFEVLLARAKAEPDVHTIRVTISPDNHASRSLVLPYGFIEVGEQWDDEDGLETIFEMPAGESRPCWSIR